MEYYPKDVDAQHLRLYILFLLKDEDFNVKAENYLQENSDRWTVKLIDSPESISLKDFSRKIVFEGNTFLPSIEKLANAKQEERIKITAQLKDFANQIYDIYCKVQQQKNKSPIFEQIKFFYEKKVLFSPNSALPGKIISPLPVRQKKRTGCYTCPHHLNYQKIIPIRWLPEVSE